MSSNKFWQEKDLSEFTEEEWESICTNCGQCCLIKLQDETGDEVYYTNVVCRYHDCQTHKCKEYLKRCELVPTCLKLTPQNIDSVDWIPETCAYNILNQTGELPDWHPLVSGIPLPDERKVTPNLVSELDVSEDELEDHILEDMQDD